MKPGIRVKLNLTKSTYTLLTDANKVVKENLGIKFCYADIKCRLKIQWVDESVDDEFFSSMEEVAGNSRQSLDVDKRIFLFKKDILELLDIYSSIL